MMFSRFLIAVVAVVAITASSVLAQSAFPSSTENEQISVICSATAGTKFCYSNSYGNFYLECLGTNVDLYKCSSTTCASGCAFSRTFQPATSIRSDFEGSRGWNFTGTVYNSGSSAGYFVKQQLFWTSSNCSSGSSPYALTLFPQGTACLAKPGDYGASDKYSCTGISGTVTNQHWSDSDSCSNSATSTTTVNVNTCFDSDKQRLFCEYNTAARAVIFKRGSAGAGKMIAAIVAVVSVVLMIVV